MMEKKQTPLPIIAGILLLVSAGFRVMVILGVLLYSFLAIVPPSFPRIGPLLFVLLPILLLVTVGLIIVGGIFSLMRKRWGWALAGAIVAILPFSFLGIAATVLVTLSKNEFNPGLASTRRN